MPRPHPASLTCGKSFGKSQTLPATHNKIGSNPVKRARHPREFRFALLGLRMWCPL
ncbi:MAG: hypothetical protein OHK0015_53300 [Chloroflexi bacterium OHK40]